MPLKVPLQEITKDSFIHSSCGGYGMYQGPHQLPLYTNHAHSIPSAMYILGMF